MTSSSNSSICGLVEGETRGKSGTVCVIGAGWYGCHIASRLLAEGLDVRLFERGNGLFEGASGANQFRVHHGFHYPRARITLEQIQRCMQRFETQYRNWLVRPRLTLYAIAKHGSLTTAMEYVKLYTQLGIPFEIVYAAPNSGLVGVVRDLSRVEDAKRMRANDEEKELNRFLANLDLEQFELILRTSEPFLYAGVPPREGVESGEMGFHPRLLSCVEFRKEVKSISFVTEATCEARQRAKVKVHSLETGAVEDVVFDYVIDCTYGAVMPPDRFVSSEELSFEPCIVLLYRKKSPIVSTGTSQQLVNSTDDSFALTIMDGPFVSLCPFVPFPSPTPRCSNQHGGEEIKSESLELYTLTHVVHTPLSSPCSTKEEAERVLCDFKHRESSIVSSVCSAMEATMRQYLPVFSSKFEYHSHFYSIKTRLSRKPASESPLAAAQETHQSRAPDSPFAGSLIPTTSEDLKVSIDPSALSASLSSVELHRECVVECHQSYVRIISGKINTVYEAEEAVWKYLGLN